MAPSKSANMEPEQDVALGDTFSLDDLRYDAAVDSDDFHYYSTPRVSVTQRFFDTIAMMTGVRRRQPYQLTASGQNGNPKLIPTTGPSARSPRTVLVRSILGRLCYILPMLILMVFGFLHVVQVILGRARIFWDVDVDDFLPNWGQPGQFGEGLAKYPTDATRDIIPIPCHSHNDYWRRIPLFEAIHYGCTGVEADVWLLDDDLYVGHNSISLSRNRTFRSLYVSPIVELLDQQNPHGEFVNATSVHGVFDTDGSQTLTLLVDFKTDGRATFPYVESQLSALRDKGYLTHFNGTHTVPGAVTVVGTGNTPFDLVVENSTYRDIFFDAPLEKLWEYPRKSISPSDIDDAIDAQVDYGTAMAHDGAPPPPPPSTSADTEDDGYDNQGDSDIYTERAAGQGSVGLAPDASPDTFNTANSYYASVSFHQTVGHIWRGHISARQMKIIRGQIRGAKRRGLKARYWDTPAWPISLRNHVWHVLVKEGADVLNVDDLRAATRLDWRRWRHEWW